MFHYLSHLECSSSTNSIHSFILLFVCIIFVLTDCRVCSNIRLVVIELRRNVTLAGLCYVLLLFQFHDNVAPPQMIDETHSMFNYKLCGVEYFPSYEIQLWKKVVRWMTSNKNLDNKRPFLSTKIRIQTFAGHWRPNAQSFYLHISNIPFEVICCVMPNHTER